MNMLFKNCNLISPDVELDGASILVENNMIRKIFAKGDALPQADKVIDVNGEMTVPGFVDVHCHGKSGVDFSDATDEAMTTIGIDKLKEGVTTFLPTTLTLPEEQLAKSLRTAANYVKNGVKGVKLAGVHLEGPFINPKCLGAQNPDFVREPDIEMVKRLAGIFPVKMPPFETAFVFLQNQSRDVDVPPWAIKLILGENDLTEEEKTDYEH